MKLSGMGLLCLSDEALGTLEARESVDLTLNVADRVTAIYFDDGDRVTKGKTLLSLAQGEQAALVDAAEATANEARQRYERTQQLAKERTVSQSALDEAARDLSAANAQLRAVQVFRPPRRSSLSTRSRRPWPTPDQS